jgi:hypothetical protein
MASEFGTRKIVVDPSKCYNSQVQCNSNAGLCSGSTEDFRPENTYELEISLTQESKDFPPGTIEHYQAYFRRAQSIIGLDVTGRALIFFFKFPSMHQ